MAERTWLITGVGGFVGSVIAQNLIEKGDTVIGLDNFYSGKLQNIEPLLDQPKFHFYENDIRDASVNTLLETHAITHVLHLAAVVSVPVCEQEPELAIDVNVKGLQHLFSLLADFPIQQFIYASSSAVYGAASQMPITEDTPLAPLSTYGKTKVQNEVDAAGFAQATGIPCIGLRFFNLFGGNPSVKNAYAAVIPLWLDAIQNKKPVIIYGDGTASRDFCHIDNVIEVIDRVVNTPLQGHQVFNVGTQQATTLNELFSLLCKACGEHLEPSYKPWRESDILHSCADITCAQKVLGYTPQVSLSEGLKRWLA